jgi:hypothetical protein
MRRGGLPEWSEADFDRAVLNFPGRAVVLFGVCFRTRLALERLSPAFPGVLVGVVTSSRLCQRFGAVGVAVVIFDAGRAVKRLIGPQTDMGLRGLLG